MEDLNIGSVNYVTFWKREKWDETLNSLVFEDGRKTPYLF